MNKRYELNNPFTNAEAPNKPFIIAGPCSAEDYNQMMVVTSNLWGMGINHIRVGIWKPRTKPGVFEGKGELALDWLDEIKTQIPKVNFYTEVITPRHVEIILKHKIDGVWIGARTTSNPFLVQEIAEALKGSDIPVLIKNPITPDLNLWIGAIDRFYNCGIKKLAAVHRGFYESHNFFYRNPPRWSIVLDLKKQIPNLPLFGDPSHMVGDSKRIYEMCTQFLNLNYEGLMIEVHPDPDNALSDSYQQISIEEMRRIMKLLSYPKATSKCDLLIPLRDKIDKIDRAIIDLIEERMRTSSELADIKYDNNINIIQPDRYNQIVQDRINYANSLGLNSLFTKSLIDLLHDESTLVQNRKLHDKKRNNPEIKRG